MIKIDLAQGGLGWLQWRKGGIGGSDIAKIMGVSPFGSAMDVYNEKSGLSDGKKKNTAMKRGNDYEAEARELFCQIKGMKFIPICGEVRGYSYMKVSLDGYCDIENTILEIKVPGKKDLDLAAAGEIPEYYMMQMQWQLMVSQAIRGYFMAYDWRTKENYIVTVQRNERMIAELQARAHIFWDEFILGIPPPLQLDEHEFIFDDKELEDDVTGYITDDKAIKEAKLRNEQRKYRITKRDTNFKAFGITATRTKPRITYDYEAMIADGLDISKYAKEGETGWRITIDK